MKFKIVKKCWWMFWAQGMVLYPFVLFSNTGPRERLYKHEFIHCYQVKRQGVLKFYLSYIWNFLRYGYKNHPMEIEAHARQDEPLTPEERKWIETGEVHIK